MEETLSRVRDEVLKSSQEGHITCAAALAIARALSIDPRVVGQWRPLWCELFEGDGALVQE